MPRCKRSINRKETGISLVDLCSDNINTEIYLCTVNSASCVRSAEVTVAVTAQHALVELLKSMALNMGRNPMVLSGLTLFFDPAQVSDSELHTFLDMIF